MNETQMSIQGIVTFARQCGATIEETKNQLLREWIVQELIAANGNQIVAAESLRVHRNTLGRYIEDLGIDVASLCRRRHRNLRLRDVVLERDPQLTDRQWRQEVGVRSGH